MCVCGTHTHSIEDQKSEVTNMFVITQRVVNTYLAVNTHLYLYISISSHIPYIQKTKLCEDTTQDLNQIICDNCAYYD